MDRDKRWERVKSAYDVITSGRAEYHAASGVEGLEAAYARGESDEFVKPTVIVAPGAQPVSMKDGDAVVFMNFRADRARQLTTALTDPAFTGFERSEQPRLGYYCTLTRYGEEYARIPAAFGPQTIENGFGEYLARKGLKQLRIAETEKYAHVTYFFNGGREDEWPGETRILVPSPREVGTYDRKPEMSAEEVARRFVDEIGDGYSFAVLNFANPDMVGHTGVIPAVVQAVETTDRCLGQVVEAVGRAGGVSLVTADHGNAETMLEADGESPHTAHTTNPVPLIVTEEGAALREGGELSDLVPTALDLLGIRKPSEMTGVSLVIPNS
jgi:2,3-bisphosphoglycerate-independent phosphoglycerate mutase